MSASEQQRIGPVEYLLGFAKMKLGVDVMSDQILNESFKQCQNEEQRLYWVRFLIEYRKLNDIDLNRKDRNQSSLLREGIESDFVNLNVKIQQIQDERFKALNKCLPAIESYDSRGTQYNGITPAEARTYYLAYSKCVCY